MPQESGAPAGAKEAPGRPNAEANEADWIAIAREIDTDGVTDVWETAEDEARQIRERSREAG